MKIATRFGLGFLCAGVFLASQAFGETTYTTPEAQKAAAQLSQPAGPIPAADTTNVNSDRSTVTGYGSGTSAAADNRPVQPIYDNSAAAGNRAMPMHVSQPNPGAMPGQHENISINSEVGQQRGEIGVWLVENGGQGVRVAKLARGGAAEQAGLKSGDIIMQVNGNSVASPREASQQIRSMSIGQVANLTLMREGNQQQLQVTLAAARPGQSYQVGYNGDSESGGERDGNGLAARTARLEQQIATMTEEIREMRQQLTGMRASSEARSAIGAATTSDNASPTSSSSTPTPPSAGSSISSSSSMPTPTPAAATTPASPTTPSSPSSGSSGTTEQDLFGTAPSGAATK